MAFKKGHKKLGGKKKGYKSPNTHVRDQLGEILGAERKRKNGQGQDLIAELLEMTKNNLRERLRLLMELLPYCYPKLAAVEMPSDTENEDRPLSGWTSDEVSAALHQPETPDPEVE